MELKYVRVPTGESFAAPENYFDGIDSYRIREAETRFFGRSRNFAISSLHCLKISNARVLSLLLFFISCICFIFTLLSIATATETYFDYPEGFARVIKERDHWKTRAAYLQSKLDQLNISSYP